MRTIRGNLRMEADRKLKRNAKVKVITEGDIAKLIL